MEFQFEAKLSDGHLIFTARNPSFGGMYGVNGYDILHCVALAF